MGLHLKNSLKNMYRSKGKSLLFIILMTALMVISSLSMSAWVSVEQYLEACDDYYHTIGVIEYIGAQYPDEDVYDPDLYEASKNFDSQWITEEDGVISYEKNARAIGYIEGFERFDHEAYYDEPLIARAEVIFEVDETGQINIESNWIREVLYSTSDFLDRPINMLEMKDFIAANNYGPGEHTIEVMFVGEAERRGYGKENIFLTSIDLVPALTYEEIMPGELFIEDVTGREDAFGIDGDSIYARLARSYSVIRNSVEVYGANNLDLQLPFNQNEMALIEGRYYTKEEALSGAKVCVVSEIIAKKHDLAVGDMLPIHIGVGDMNTTENAYYDPLGFDAVNEYQVIGIFRTPKEMNYHLYIPISEDLPFSNNQIGYTIGTVEIENALGDQFYSHALKKLDGRLKMTIYDQGYAKAAKPFYNIRRISMIIALSSIIAILLVVILFAFLFVFRQRMVADVMVKMGTGIGPVYRYYLYGTFLITSLSTIVGAYIGSQLNSYVEETLLTMLANQGGISDAFSNGSLSITKTFQFSPDISQNMFLIIGLIVILSALVSSGIFVRNALAEHHKRGKKSHFRPVKKSSTMGAGPIRYSILSMSRGLIRTVAVIGISLTMVIFIGQLTQTTKRYEENIESLINDTVISGQFTDLKGRTADKLNVEAFNIQDLFASGKINSIGVAKEMPYIYMGVVEQEGITYDIPPLEPPTGFAYDRFISTLEMGDKVVFTNDLFSTPEFKFTNDIRLEFLEPYDMDVFASNIDSNICIVSKDFLNEHNLRLGDSIKNFVQFEGHINANIDKERLYKGVDFTIIGTFEKEFYKDNIYVPVASLISMDDLLYEKNINHDIIYVFTFDSTIFTVKASELEDLRNYMIDYGFSEFNEIRTYRSSIVLEDKVYTSTLELLNKQLGYIDILYPILYGLIAVLALVMGYLISHGRKKEGAIMLGLGTEKNKIFTSFFLEQVILIILGTGIGIGIGYMNFHGFDNFYWLMVGAFVGLYLLGCGIALNIMIQMNPLKLLKVEE